MNFKYVLNVNIMLSKINFNLHVLKLNTKKLNYN